MQSNTPKASQLAIFWFGLQAVWGALLGISLQARSIQLHPDHALLAYGQLATIGALVATVTQLVIAPFSDRLRARGGDRRIFFIAGTLLGGIGVLAFYAAPTFAMLIGALFVLQIGLNAAIGPYQAVIPDYFDPAVSGRASAWMAGLQSLGNTAGAVAAAFAPRLGLPQWSIGAGLVVLLALTCAVTALHAGRFRPRAITAQDARFTFTRSSADLFISRALLWTGFYTMLGYMLFYVRDTLGVADATPTTGIVIVIFTVFGAAGAALVATPADRFDRRAVVNACTAVFVASLCGFALTRNTSVMFAMAAAAGVGWGGFLASDWALGCSVLPRNMMATAMAVWNIAVAGPQVLAPVLATALILALRPDPATAPLFAFGLAVTEVTAGALWIWRIPARVTQVTQI